MYQSSLEHRYRELAYSIIEYLKTKLHTEAPHISILSPEYAAVQKIKYFKEEEGQTLLESPEEGEGDFDPEALAESLDPTKIRGHATHGVKAAFESFTADSEIIMKTKFYIRKAPPSEFRLVAIATTLRKGRLEVRLSVVDDAGGEIYNHTYSTDIDIDRGALRIILGVGHRGIVREAAHIISKALYPGARLVEIADDRVVDALSTAELTRKGQEFLLLPSLNKQTSSREYSAVQNFLYEIEVSKRGNKVEVSFVLRYIAPALVKKSTKQLVPVGRKPNFPTYVYIQDHRDRWSVHHLLEVESRLIWRNVQPAWGWEQRLADGRVYAGLHGLTPIGALAAEDDECNQGRGCLHLRDWHIEVEKIYPVKKSGNALMQSFRIIGEKLAQDVRSGGFGVDEEALRKALNIVAEALRSAFPHIDRLYEFQERALYEGLKALLVGEHKVLVLQARTAGGKTLAFLLPILVYTLYAKLAGIDREGVKALLFYPTVALQNDQAATVFKLLWHVNSILYLSMNSAVSLGMLHRYTPKRDEEVYVQELRLRCPLCDNRLIISWNAVKGAKIYEEAVKCSNSSCDVNNQGTFESMLLGITIRASRDAIYSNPPDLLIANPDIINARMTLAGREDPAALTILGKPAYVCKRCGLPHDIRSRPTKCGRCGSNEFHKKQFTHPKIVVVDEAHMLRGAFGAQVSHVLTRLEQAIRRLNSLSDSWRPLYFISSATLNNPRERARELTAAEPDKIVEITAEAEGAQAEQTLRIHAFVMPKLYSPEATASRIAEALYLEASALDTSYRDRFNGKLVQLRRELFGGRKPPPPALLIFVNRISEANELLNHIRHYVSGVESDGHTTDYSSERARVEDRFSRGELGVIVATSGLEVGVDFDRVDVGMIYGMPFYISDYTQRIGRIGRRHHCIIFNVFMPDKPIDHFYYRNWKLLSDGSLRDAHMRSEAYRINRENPEAIRRSAQRAVLDMISTLSGAGELLGLPLRAKRGRYKPAVMEALNMIKSEAESYLGSALRISNTQNALAAAQRLINDIERNVNSGSCRSLREAVESAPSIPLGQLRNLRSLEPQVRYKFSPINEERDRDLVYAVRHSLPGQIISYRGSFYTINIYRGVHIYYPL